jgi:hypothetical protein
MNALLTTLSAFADGFTIVASGLAIYIFFTKRQEIASAFRVLLNFSSQLALGELRLKLDQLNDLSANDPTDKDKVVNIFNDILGQIRGNKVLCIHCADVMPKLVSAAENRRYELTEPRKRALVSELREVLRHVDVESYRDLIGERK